MEQDRYESSYVLVAGDLKKPIPFIKIRDFLEELFPSFQYPISNYNIKETLDVFGRHGSKSREIFWADIRKTIREHQGNGNIGERLLIGTVINPKSIVFRKWISLMKFVAIYHFLVVPIRIAFLPWSSMTDFRALCSDLVADFVTVMHVIVLANTAVLSTTSKWMTDRKSLLRNVESGFILSAVPFDWYRFMLVFGIQNFRQEYDNLELLQVQLLVWCL